NLLELWLNFVGAVGVPLLHYGPFRSFGFVRLGWQEWAESDDHRGGKISFTHGEILERSHVRFTGMMAICLSLQDAAGKKRKKRRRLSAKKIGSSRFHSIRLPLREKMMAGGKSTWHKIFLKARRRNATQVRETRSLTSAVRTWARRLVIGKSAGTVKMRFFLKSNSTAGKRTICPW